MHPAVADTKVWRRYTAEVAELEAKHAKVTERMRAAEADHQAALAEYRRQLDAGTAPASGPPVWHPPADPARIQHERAALRSRRTEVLAQLADQAEAALRAREGELLVRAAELVDELEPIRTELVEMLQTMRALSAARGVPGGDSTVPASLDLAELVTLAAFRDRLLPTELVPTREDPPAWTRDDPEAIPDRHYGRAAMRGRR